MNTAPEKRATPATPPLRHARTAIVFLALTAALTFFFTWPREARRNVALAERIPREIGVWRGEDQQIDQHTYDVLGTDDVLARSYAADDRRPPVQFLVIFARHTRRATHPPEICLKGENWSAEQMNDCTIDLGPGRSGFPVRELLMLRGEDRLLVHYFFKNDGGYSASYWGHQVRVAMAKLFNPNASDAMVRVETLLGNGEDVDEARRRLDAFLKAIFPEVDACLVSVQKR